MVEKKLRKRRPLMVVKRQENQPHHLPNRQRPATQHLQVNWLTPIQSLKRNHLQIRKTQSRQNPISTSFPCSRQRLMASNRTTPRRFTDL